jgi:hypothetical protein
MEDEDISVRRRTGHHVFVQLSPGLPDLERRYAKSQRLIPTSLNLDYKRSEDGPWVHTSTLVSGPRRLKSGSKGLSCDEYLTSFPNDPPLPEWVVDRIERYRPRD